MAAYAWRVDVPIVSCDANSLYPTAMASILTFPDLSSAQGYQNPSPNTLIEWNTLGYNYIVKCNVFLPHDLKFVPVPNKTAEPGKTFYSVGNINDMVWCDTDIKEILRYGGKVTKVMFAILFTKKDESHLAKVIQQLYNARKEAIKNGNTILANLCK